MVYYTVQAYVAPKTIITVSCGRRGKLSLFMYHTATQSYSYRGSVMSSESTHAINAAILSAESLFASLLDRVPPGKPSSPDHTPSDPEVSLSPGQRAMSPEGSIVSVGTASLDPAHLMAASHAVYENLDPRESLSAIGEDCGG